MRWAQASGTHSTCSPDVRCGKPLAEATPEAVAPPLPCLPPCPGDDQSMCVSSATLRLRFPLDVRPGVSREADLFARAIKDGGLDGGDAAAAAGGAAGAAAASRNCKPTWDGVTLTTVAARSCGHGTQGAEHFRVSRHPASQRQHRQRTRQYMSRAMITRPVSHARTTGLTRTPQSRARAVSRRSLRPSVTGVGVELPASMSSDGLGGDRHGLGGDADATCRADGVCRGSDSRDWLNHACKPHACTTASCHVEVMRGLYHKQARTRTRTKVGHTCVSTERLERATAHVRART